MTQINSANGLQDRKTYRRTENESGSRKPL